MKIAFLDRDGTINRDYPDAQWSTISEPEILDGVLEGMKHILRCGYKIIIVTNQYTIGEGYISIGQYYTFHKKLLDILENNGISVLDTFYCPHDRSADCDCCKPKTGLIHQAFAKYPDIDIGSSFMCGDSTSDMLCALNVGLKFYGINIGDHAIKSLADLYNYI
ncbi:MAG: HAD-IIIA family hydrolase [Clostridia bacterium]|nr:HAD-IIIA family hydrolase [Clostridia bacterium]